jgi:hypothetical protein
MMQDLDGGHRKGLTDRARDPDRRKARNTLSFYLNFSTFSSPVTEIPLGL